jgi:NADPH2:quinone reductase
MMITFGNSSGKPPPFDLAQLAPLGSLKITRPSVFTHIAQHETCQTMARHLFDKVTKGAVEIRIDQRFALEDVAAAHRSLESRQTMGSTVLTI